MASMIVLVLPVPGGCKVTGSVTCGKCVFETYPLNQSKSIVQHHSNGLNLCSVEILQYRVQCHRSFLFRILSPDLRTLQVVLLVYFVGREKVVHDNEVNFPSVRQFDSMQTVEPRDESMRILLDVGVVFLQDLQKEFVLRVVDGLDDEPKVFRKVEESARLPRG